LRVCYVPGSVPGASAAEDWWDKAEQNRGTDREATPEVSQDLLELKIHMKHWGNSILCRDKSQCKDPPKTGTQKGWSDQIVVSKVRSNRGDQRGR
jgi:hypothetical protein